MRASLKDLAPLLGEWREEATLEGKVYRARATFESLGDGFVVWRSATPAPFPSSIAIIGEDDGRDDLAMHYFDTRGVARLYRTALRGGEWRIWRDHPGFSQRFFGRLNADGKRIDARWEKKEDDGNWKLDFPLVYVRTRRLRRSPSSAAATRSAARATRPSRRGRANRRRSPSEGPGGRTRSR